jgi:hypothetical protein
MNRRSFIRQLFIGGIGTSAAIEHMLSGSQILISSDLPLSLYGVPYHQSNAHIGTWMGIQRSTYPQFSSGRWVGFMHPDQHKIYSDLLDLVDKMENKK